MKLIPLTRGEFAMVDDADYERVSQHKWWLASDKCALKYAVGQVGGRTVRMHRFIFGVSDPCQQLDHVNGNGLDNRRSNLRRCNGTQNQANQHPAHGRSPFKGVCWGYRPPKWQARIMKNGKVYRLGYFKFEVDAAWAYDLAARDLFGKHACLNFPDVGDQGVIFPDDIPREAFLSARVMFES